MRHQVKSQGQLVVTMDETIDEVAICEAFKAYGTMEKITESDAKLTRVVILGQLVDNPSVLAAILVFFDPTTRCVASVQTQIGLDFARDMVSVGNLLSPQGLSSSS